jgi:hypothetical protein
MSIFVFVFEMDAGLDESTPPIDLGDLQQALPPDYGYNLSDFDLYPMTQEERISFAFTTPPENAGSTFMRRFLGFRAPISQKWMFWKHAPRKPQRKENETDESYVNRLKQHDRDVHKYRRKTDPAYREAQRKRVQKFRQKRKAESTHTALVAHTPQTTLSTFTPPQTSLTAQTALAAETVLSVDDTLADLITLIEALKSFPKIVSVCYMF